MFEAKDQQSSVERVLQYLNLPYFDLKGRYVRMKSDDLGLYLANAEEIKSFLATTRYAHFLEE